MVSTEKFTVTSTEWKALSNGEPNVGIQLISLGQILVHIAEADPPIDAPGILIGRKTDLTPSEFSVSALPNTTKVYAKSHNCRSIDLVVIKY